MVNASESGSRGRGFEPHSGQIVLCPCARRIYSPKVLVIPRKRWLRPNMTEKLFTGTLRINQPTNLIIYIILDSIKSGLYIMISDSSALVRPCHTVQRPTAGINRHGQTTQKPTQSLTFFCFEMEDLGEGLLGYC